MSETALASAVLSIAAAAGEAPAPAVGLALLIADHDPANRERIKNLLERAGHTIEGAADGGAALAALDRGGFDAALIELDMPGVSGDAVAKLHRLRHPGGTVPLFALAAGASAETEARCRDAGFDAVMKRPLDLAELGARRWRARGPRGAPRRAHRGRPGPRRRRSRRTRASSASRPRRCARRPSDRCAVQGRQRLPRGGDRNLPRRRGAARGAAAPGGRTRRPRPVRRPKLTHALASGAIGIGGVQLTRPSPHSRI